MMNKHPTNPWGTNFKLINLQHLKLLEIHNLSCRSPVATKCIIVFPQHSQHFELHVRLLSLTSGAIQAKVPTIVVCCTVCCNLRAEPRSHIWSIKIHIFKSNLTKHQRIIWSPVIPSLSLWLSEELQREQRWEATNCCHLSCCQMLGIYTFWP